MPFRAVILALLCAFLIIFKAPAAASTHAVKLAATPALLDTEDAAQWHCPRDVGVWLNMPTGIYRVKGMRWYGRTKPCAFV